MYELVDLYRLNSGKHVEGCICYLLGQAGFPEKLKYFPSKKLLMRSSLIYVVKM